MREKDALHSLFYPTGSRTLAERTSGDFGTKLAVWHEKYNKKAEVEMMRATHTTPEVTDSRQTQ